MPCQQIAVGEQIFNWTPLDLHAPRTNKLQTHIRCGIGNGAGVMVLDFYLDINVFVAFRMSIEMPCAVQYPVAWSRESV